MIYTYRVFGFILSNTSFAHRRHALLDFHSILFNFEISFWLYYFSLHFVHWSVTIELKPRRKLFLNYWNKIFVSNVVKYFLFFLIFNFTIVHLFILLLFHCIFDKRFVVTYFRCVGHPCNFWMGLNFRFIL